MTEKQEQQKKADKNKTGTIRKCARGSCNLGIWIVTTFLTLTILINVAFWSGIWWLNHTQSGQNFINRQIGHSTVASGYEVDIGGFFYAFPAQMRLDTLEIRRNGQPVITGEQIYINAQKFSLEKKKITAAILARNLTIHPSLEDKPPSETKKNHRLAPIELPQASLDNSYIKVVFATLKIATVTVIDKEDLQKNLILTLDTSVKVNLAEDKVDVDIQIESKNDQIPSVVASIFYDTQSSRLDIKTAKAEQEHYEINTQGKFIFRAGERFNLDIQTRVKNMPELNTVHTSIEAQNIETLPVTIKANAQYKAYPISVNAALDITGDQVNIKNIAASLPSLKMNGNAFYNMDTAALSADISAALENLQPYREYIEAAHMIEPSIFTVKIRENIISLTANVPAYRNRAYQVGVKDVHLAATMKDQIFSIDSLTLKDDKGGDMKATGTYMMDKQNFDLSITAKALDIFQSRMVTGTISADIQAQGNMNNTQVTGTITPGRIMITLPENFKTSIAELNVVETNDRKPPPEQTQNIMLDVIVDAKNQIFVTGYGLDAEFGGRLKVTGKADSPLFDGNLDIIRGRFEQFGKRLSVSRGKLVFSGAIPPSPFLDIIVESKADDILAKINITGNAIQPNIGFSSDPPLPEDEVLSKLLFGESMENISPFQAAQIAQFVAGGGSGGGTMSAIKDKAGLDDLRVENDGGQTLIGAGTYLSDNVYLDLQSGTEPGSASATLQIELTPNVKVESEIGQDSQGGAGIFWEFDY